MGHREMVPGHRVGGGSSGSGQELPCLLKTPGQIGGSPSGLGEAQGIVLVMGKVGRGIPASCQVHRHPAFPPPWPRCGG